MIRISHISTVILVVFFIFLGCEREDAVEPVAHEAFFQNLRDLCGQKFEGYTDFVLLPESPLADGHLIMHVETCTDTEIRIPFIVNEDRSRTWVLTLHDDGLLFKHDHRHPDGTPEDTTMYGGWADEEGTSYVQYFPADEYTAELIPDAETNVWMVEINPETGQFIYYLERHDEPRFRAVFDLSQPLSE
jgi:hypothetical protein